MNTEPNNPNKEPWENNNSSENSENNEAQQYYNQSNNQYQQPTGNNYSYGTPYGQPGYYQPPKKKISTGGIVAIVIGCIVLFGIIAVTIMATVGMVFVKDSGIIDEAVSVFSEEIDDGFNDYYSDEKPDETIVADGVEYLIYDGEAKVNRVYDYYCNKELKIASEVGKAKYPVTSIDDYAFENAKYIEKVIIPDSVKYIGDCAFESSEIKSVYVPSSVVEVGDCAFDCSNITVNCEDGSYILEYAQDNSVNYNIVDGKN